MTSNVEKSFLIVGIRFSRHYDVLISTANNEKTLLNLTRNTEQWSRFETVDDRCKELVKKIPQVSNYTARQINVFQNDLAACFDNCGILPQLLECKLSEAEVNTANEVVRSYAQLRSRSGNNPNGIKLFTDASGITWKVGPVTVNNETKMVLVNAYGRRVLTEEECKRVVTCSADSHAWNMIERLDTHLGRYELWKNAKTAWCMVKSEGDTQYDNLLMDWDGVKNFLTAYRASLQLASNGEFLAALRKSLGIDRAPEYNDTPTS